MKEASGELSMTAVAVVAIAAIGILFTTLIYPNIKQSLVNQQLCSAAFACSCGNSKTCKCSAYSQTGSGATASSKLVSVTCENPDKAG